MKPTFLLLSISLLLAACATAAPEPTAVPLTSTPLPSATPTVTPSPKPTHEPTPVPLTMNDVLGMDEGTKLQILNATHPEYTADNQFCSQELPNICVVDTGTDYLLYDIIQGEFVTVDEAGLIVFRRVDDGGHLEMRNFSDIQDMHRFISIDEGGKGGISDINTHKDAWNIFSKVLMSKNLFDIEIIPRSTIGYSMRDLSDRQEDFYVSAKSLRNKGGVVTFIVYIDRNGELKYLSVRGFSSDHIVRVTGE